VTDPTAPDPSPDPFESAPLPVDGPDELAGVVDLFGALGREELLRALVELAYRQRGDVDESAVATAAEPAVAWAVERYYLVEYAPDEATDGDDATDGEPLLTVGPVAFPALPAEAEDLPHILDYPTRSVSRASLARSVETRLRGDTARAVAAADEERVRHLFDVTYDLEAWAPVDVTDVRDRLDDVLAELESDSESGADGDADAGSE
jgi:hypothetical protein